MTYASLITANAVAGAVVVYGLLHLLVAAIWSDQRHSDAQIRELPAREHERIAA